MATYGPRSRSSTEQFGNHPTAYLSGVNFNGSANWGDTTPLGPWPVEGFSKGYESTQIDDVCVQNYKRRVSNGEVINNPLYLEKRVQTMGGPGSFHRERVNKDGLGNYWGSIYNSAHCKSEESLQPFLQLSNIAGYLSEVSTLKQQAIQQAHANCSSTELASLMVAAEGRKSIESMGEILTRVTKIVRAAKRLDLKYLRKQISAKELANRYMELRYALRPLAIDFEHAAYATVSMEAYKRVRATARGYASCSGEFTDQVIVTNSNEKATYGRRITVECNIRAGVLCDIQTSLISVNGLDQPIEAIFEIVPFSFIAGWFFNIADVISAWSPNAGIRELASWVTVEETIVQHNSLDDVENTESWNYRDVYTWSGQFKNMTKTIKTREVNPELSIWPTSKIRLDTLKLLDLAIIGKGLLGRR